MSERPTLNPPEDITLPYFAYGLFKPGELAYRQIVAFLSDEPTIAELPGVLWIRDGLPLLEPMRSGAAVRGSLLTFGPGTEAAAYKAIADFEPRKHYRWERVQVLGQSAWTVVGNSPRKGSVQSDEGFWTGCDDPVLTDGMKVVQEAVISWAGPQFSSAPPHRFDWPRLFRLQMAYLLLWSAVERYCALAYGPSLEPLRKIDALGGDAAFGEHLARVVKRTDRVYDSRDPGAHADLKPGNPSSSARYYYQVRSNLSHRGKGAWRDGEIVRQSLVELRAIFIAVLESAHVRPVSASNDDESAA